MRVSDALDVGAIITGAAWTDFEAAAAGLVTRLVESGVLPAHLHTPAVAAVVERERVASTAMVDIGVSIPHTRLDGVSRIICGLATAPTAIYGAAAGMPISIMALVLSPPALTGEHLNFLAALSMLLHSTAVRRRLQSAATPQAALELIRTHER